MAIFSEGRKTIPLGEGVHSRASGAYHPDTGAVHRNNSPRVIRNQLPVNRWVPRNYFHFGSGETKMEYDTTGNNLVAREASFESAFPEFTKVNMGTSFSGRTIFGYRLGSSATKHFVVICGVHGNEVDGVNGAFKAMEILARHQDFTSFRSEWTLFFVPALNPDGWKLGTRNTAQTGPNGETINLNRNWDWFWSEYVETDFESKGSAPGSTPEATALLNYKATGNGGGPVTFGYLMDMHANQGVGARYQSRDRVWRGIANGPETFLPVPTGFISVYLDWFIFRMAQAATTYRAKNLGGPNYYTRYLRSRFRPHLHAYFSSLGVPSMAVEEVKVSASLGRETYQTSCNYRLDYILAAAAACTQSNWTSEDGVLIDQGGTNLLSNSSFEQWQTGDVRPGFWTPTRASIQRQVNIPEILPATQRLFNDGGEAIQVTSNVDVNLAASSEFTRAAQDGPQSIVCVSPNTAAALQIKVGDNAFTGTILTLASHTNRVGTALVHGLDGSVVMLAGGTAAPSTGALNTCTRITTSGTPAESGAGTLNVPRMFHAAADNFLSFPSASSKRAYVFGGYSAIGALLDSIEIWNPNTNSASVSAAVLPSARADATAVYYPPTNHVFIFGGTTGGGVVSSILDYNVSGDSISTHATAMSTALKHVAGAYSPATGKIYLFGGEDGLGTMSSAVYSFNPSTGVFLTETVTQNLGDDENAEESDESGPWVTPIGRWGSTTLVESSSDGGTVYNFGGRQTNSAGSLLSSVYTFDSIENIIGLSREAEYGYVRYSTPVVDTKYAVEVTDSFASLDEVTVWEDPSGVWEASLGSALGSGVGPLKLRNLPDYENQEITLDVSWQDSETPLFDVILRGTFSGATLTGGYIVRYDGTVGNESWKLVRVVSSVETVVQTVSVSADATKQISNSVLRTLVAKVEDSDPVHYTVTFNSQSIMDSYDLSTNRITIPGQVAFRRGT